MSHPAKNLYITSMEPRSGKSVISLGLMELMSRRIRKVGFFRPVVPDGEHDNHIQLIASRYGLDMPRDAFYAYRHEKAMAMATGDQANELLQEIVAKYRSLESQCNFVLCEGTDYTGVSSAFEFDFNAEIAVNLGAPVLVVVNGRNRCFEEVEEAVRVARDAHLRRGCDLVAIVLNRVDPALLPPLFQRFETGLADGTPVFVLPEDDSIGKPTVGEVFRAVEGRVVHGGKEVLSRSVRSIVIAAMRVSNFLDYLEEGSLVITPGDRSDIILASLATTVSDTYPAIAGMVLTGGLKPDHQVMRMIEGFRSAPVPIAHVTADTYSTATRVNAVRSELTPGDERKIAAALGLFEAHVDLSRIEARFEMVRSERRTPIMFEYELIQRAKAAGRHIVLPEGVEERILRAAEILLRRGVCGITLLGDEREIGKKISLLGLKLDGARIVDPVHSTWHDEFAHAYHELRQHKGISEKMAADIMTDVSYFGTMMVHAGKSDGMVSGSVNTTAHTIRPAFEIIRTRPGVAIVSSVFFMGLADRILVYGDCAVNPNPDAEQLADIAVSSADTALQFGIDPRVAMLSYSSGDSGSGKDVVKVRDATRLVRQRRPDLQVEGPIQYDAAIDASVARTKLPDSKVAGRATVFVFPDLNTGNNTYKAVQRSAGATAIGPVLQGLNRPVNDLSRGCTVTDIVNTVAITAVQAGKEPGDA